MKFNLKSRFDVNDTQARAALEGFKMWFEFPDKRLAMAAKKLQDQLHHWYCGWQSTVKRAEFWNIGQAISTLPNQPLYVRFSMRSGDSETVSRSGYQEALFKSWNRPDFCKSSFVEVPPPAEFQRLSESRKKGKLRWKSTCTMSFSFPLKKTDWFKGVPLHNFDDSLQCTFSGYSLSYLL